MKKTLISILAVVVVLSCSGCNEELANNASEFFNDLAQPLRDLVADAGVDNTRVNFNSFPDYGSHPDMLEETGSGMRWHSIYPVR